MSKPLREYHDLLQEAQRIGGEHARVTRLEVLAEPLDGANWYAVWWEGPPSGSLALPHALLDAMDKLHALRAKYDVSDGGGD